MKEHEKHLVKRSLTKIKEKIAAKTKAKIAKKVQAKIAAKRIPIPSKLQAKIFAKIGGHKVAKALKIAFKIGSQTLMYTSNLISLGIFLLIGLVTHSTLFFIFSVY